MSKYTTELRYICEAEAGLTESTGFNDIQTILEESAPKIFNFSFPIFDENYRLPLEIKILRHFYTREICEETVGLWKLRLQDKLNTIMPYYNKLYNSELIEFNPLYDVDLTKDHKLEHDGNENSINVNEEKIKDSLSSSKIETTDNKTNKTTDSDSTNVNTSSVEQTYDGKNSGSSNDTTDSNKWDLYSDTPQGGITLMGSGETVANNTYLTNARNVQDNVNNTQINTSDMSGSQSTSTTDSANGNVKSSEEENFDGVKNNTEETTKLNDRTNTNSNTKDIKNVEDYIEHINGKQGTTSFSKMLMEFRETFLNIDAMILKDLNPLFFNLW